MTSRPHRAVVRLAPEQLRSAEEVLLRVPVAFVAVVDPAGSPYVVPMNFAYASGRLYLHTGPGRKADALAADSRVCMTATMDEVFEQGPTPCKDGFAYRSVVVEGRATILAEPEERETALRAIITKYDPAAAGKPLDGAVLSATLVYAVDIENISHKERPRREVT